MPDPFYQQIVSALEGDLDPRTFEEAAVDLLRADYPGLAPISGGSDHGMDGAIPDLEGEALPLISTISQDAIENLTENIRSYVKRGNPRRHAVFATPRALTPLKRKNLEERARELGFTLLNIHDQADFAQRLYRNSRWSRTLLGLTGNPPALSVVPLSSRPRYDVPVVGREATLEWIRSLDGDGLLVGQPGAGKTYILQKLALEDKKGLFAVSRDRTELAASIRDQSPEVIFVDDAHVSPDLIDHLCQIRGELEAEYRILATSWPSGADHVAERLGIPTSAAHELPLLTRDEILSVVEGMGIAGPALLQYEIVSQAQGRPGLAVTFAHAVLSGFAREVMSGQLLERLVDAVARDMPDTRVRQILASVSVGGASGHRLKSVATALGLDLASVHNAVVTLGRAGIVRDRGDFVVVTPSALGHALTRDVFFAGQLSLPREVYLELFDSAPSKSAAAENLLEARVRGASVPLELAAAVAEEYGQWRALARSGQDALEWILRSRPERIRDVQTVALTLRPKDALGLLFNEVGEDTSAEHSNPEHPLRAIQDWAKDPRGRPAPLTRREILVDEIKRWLDAGGSPATAVRCLPLVFDLDLEYGELDPGAGTRFVIHNAAFLPDGYAELAAHFPGVLEMLRERPIEDWEPLLSVVESWAFARVHSHSVAPVKDIREHGLRMVRQLAEFASNAPAVIHRLREICLPLGVEGELEGDRVLEAVFPLGYRRSFDESDRARAWSNLEALSIEWSHLPLAEAIDNLAFVEEAERSMGRRWPNWTSQLCKGMAERVQDPTTFAAELVRRQMPAHFLSPALYEAVTRGGESGARLLTSLLGSEAYCRAAFLVALSNQSSPEDAIATAIDLAPSVSDLVDEIAWTPTVSNQVKAALLDHHDVRVSGEAVEALVHSYRDGTLPVDLRGPWRRALVRQESRAHGFVVSEAVRGDPDLALDWLENALVEPEHRLIDRDGAVAAAIAELTVEQRIRLLGEELPPKRGLDGVVVMLLVGDDPEVYGELLKSEALRRLHLAPLAITAIDGEDVADISDPWIEKAKLALDRGYSPRQIAQAMTAQGWGFMGSEARYWGELNAKTAVLGASDHEGIREVGLAASEMFRKYRDEAQARERDEAIFGR